MQVKKQQLELDMEQQTGSKSGKEYVKAVCCHPAYLTYIQSTSWEMLGWMKLESSWNQDCLGIQTHHFMANRMFKRTLILTLYYT